METVNFSEKSHRITLRQAEEMTKRFRQNKEKILNPDVDPSVLANSETFNKEAFAGFMKDEACKGVRIYYGMSEDLKVHAILVGVDAENRDILPADAESTDDDNGIYEDGQRCPPFCTNEPPLNEP